MTCVHCVSKASTFISLEQFSQTQQILIIFGKLLFWINVTQKKLLIKWRLWHYLGLLLLLHLFNGLFSRTTWVSQYQKGKTILDLNEARDEIMYQSLNIVCTLIHFKQIRAHVRVVLFASWHSIRYSTFKCGWQLDRFIITHMKFFSSFCGHQPMSKFLDIGWFLTKLFKKRRLFETLCSCLVFCGIWWRLMYVYRFQLMITSYAFICVWL